MASLVGARLLIPVLSSLSGLQAHNHRSLSALVPPDCAFGSGDFDGTTNFDLSTICTDTWGGAVSVAFSARVDAVGPAQIYDFFPIDQAGDPILSERGFEAHITDAGIIRFGLSGDYVSSAGSVVGLTQRYLVTVSSSGYFQVIVDGVVLGGVATSGAMSSQTRAMFLASRMNYEWRYVDALIEDFYIFHSEVGWDSAVYSWITTTTTTTTSSATSSTSTSTSTPTTTTSSSSTTSTTSTTTSISTSTSTSMSTTVTTSTASTTSSTTSSSVSTSTSSSSTTSSTSSTSSSVSTSSTTTTSTASSTSSSSTSTSTVSTTVTTSSTSGTTSSSTTTTTTTASTLTMSSTTSSSTSTTSVSTPTSTSSTSHSTSTSSTRTTSSTSSTLTSSTSTGTSSTSSTASSTSSTTATFSTSTTSSTSRTFSSSTATGTSVSSTTSGTSTASTASITSTAPTTDTSTSSSSGTGTSPEASTSNSRTSTTTVSTTSTTAAVMSSMSTATTASTSSRTTGTGSTSSGTSTSSTVSSSSRTRSTTTSSSTTSFTKPSVATSTSTSGTASAAAVKIGTQIEGVAFATLEVASSARSAFVSAFEQGIWEVLNSTSASAITASDLSTRLLPAGALQTAGVQVETTIMSPSPEQLSTTLQGATDSLTTAIKSRLEAAVQSTVAVSSISVQLVQLEATSTTSPTTTNTVAQPGPTPSPSTEEQITGLTTQVTSVLSRMVAQLMESNETSFTGTIAGGIVKSTKLESLITQALGASGSNATQPERVVLDISEVDVTITIPLVFLDNLPPNVAPKDVVIAVGLIDPTSEESGLSSLASKDDDGTPTTLEAVMVLDFFGPDGTTFNISSLAEPIEFTMQANYSARSNCVFWDDDGQQWSDKGVSESSKNQVGDQLVCLTEHLSLFGALLRGIVNAILCSQLSLLNPEGIANLARGDWYKQVGAVFYWWVLAVLLAMGGMSFGIDACRSRMGRSWPAEFFLCVSDEESRKGLTEEEATEETSEAGGEDARQGFLGWAVCCCLSCGAAACACFKETAARDALDEIMSQWFEQFSEVRSCLEGCWDGLEFASLGAGRISQLSHSAMCQVTLSSARRLTGASLHLSDEMVAFVLGDEDLQDLLMRRYDKLPLRAAAVDDQGAGQTTSSTRSLSRGTTMSTPRPRWFTSKDQSDAWFFLHLEICECVHRHISNHSVCNLPRAVLQIFLMHNPIGLVFCHDIFFSCKLRCLFHALEINGSLMVTAVFFSASGAARGKPSGSWEKEPDECDPEDEDVLFYIGRAVVVALGSVLLSGLPVTFLQSLHTRSLKMFACSGSREWHRQLRAWYVQDTIIWVCGSLYLVFCVFFVSLFLANVADKDHEQFVNTGLLCIIHGTIMMPLVVAIFVPTVSSLLLIVNGAFMGGQETVLRDVHHCLHAKTNVMLPIVTI